jgi:hypothetical protein
MRIWRSLKVDGTILVTSTTLQVSCPGHCKATDCRIAREIQLLIGTPWGQAGSKRLLIRLAPGCSRSEQEKLENRFEGGLKQPLFPSYFWKRPLFRTQTVHNNTARHQLGADSCFPYCGKTKSHPRTKSTSQERNLVWDHNSMSSYEMYAPATKILNQLWTKR